MRLRLPAIPAAVAVATGIVLPVFLTGALSVQIRASLHLDEARLGLAVASFFLAAALSSAAFGHLVQRIGAVQQMRLALLLSGVCCAAVALFVRIWWELPLVLAVGGMANAAGQPAANLLLARAVKPQRQGLAFGAKQAAIPLATLLAGLAVPSVALTLGWRFAFVCAAGLAVLAVSVLPVATRPERHPRSGSGPSDVRSSRSGEEGLSNMRGAAETFEARTSEKRKELATLVVLACAMALGSAAATSLGAFVVPACVSAGFRPGTAGLIAALGSLVGVSARVVAGMRADKRGGRHLRAVALMLASGSIGYLGLALGSQPVDIISVAVAFGAAWGWPGLFNLAVVRTHGHAPGWATGVTQTGAYAGGVLGPFIFGLVVEHASYGLAWLVDAGLALAAVGGMLVARRMLHQRKADQAQRAGQ